MTKELIEKGVTRYAEEAKKVYGSKLYRFILFGSCARGDFNNESDVDIMILLDVPPEEIPRERRKTSEIYSLLDMEFDYDILFSTVVQSKDVFMKYGRASNFYMNVEKEGIDYV